MRRRIAAFVAAILLAVSMHAQEPIHLSAPPEFAATARALKAISANKLDELRRLTGTPPNAAPIEVTLAPERSSLAAPVPRWVAGYAIGSAGLVVIFPARNPRYPDDSLEETYLHELTHVYVDRAAGGRPVPRWFNEGVAVVAGRSWTLQDQARFSLSAFFAGEPSPAELDRRFVATQEEAAGAYALSEAFVRDLLQTYGPTTVADILREVRSGESFSRAFFDATTLTPERALDRFWERQGWRRQMIPILTSSALLWLLITGIGVAAIFRRRKRDELQKDLWDAEESLHDLRSEHDDDAEDEADDELVN